MPGRAHLWRCATPVVLLDQNAQVGDADDAGPDRPAREFEQRLACGPDGQPTDERHRSRCRSSALGLPALVGHPSGPTTNRHRRPHADVQ